MKSITAQRLRNDLNSVRRELAAERELLVTAGGRPFAVLTSVNPDQAEKDLLDLHRARALVAMDRMGAWAKAKGLDRMTMDEVDALIAKVRRSRQTRARQGK